jgi:hypothetical protein
METAFLSGLRAHELRSLAVDDLDVGGCGVRLHAEWTKNRKDGFHPIPTDPIGRLHDFAHTGEAKVLYARYKRRDATVELPSDPLLYVPSHPARSLDKDLETAGIPKHAPIRTVRWIVVELARQSRAQSGDGSRYGKCPEVGQLAQIFQPSP